MGQKVNPIGFRIGISKPATSRWFADKKTYSTQVKNDFDLRQLLEKELEMAGLVRADIERSVNAIKVTLVVAKPGVVIGKGGSNLETLKKKIEKVVSSGRSGVAKKEKVKIDILVEEVPVPELAAKLIAEKIAQQLIKRFPHRRAVLQAIDKAMQSGAKGIKIQLSGRIGGAEIARTEKYFEGSIPTQTLRSKLDYYAMPIHTKSGYVGIKIWVNADGKKAK